MFNTNTFTNLVKKTFFNSPSKSEISTKPNIKGIYKSKSSAGLTKREMEEQLLEYRMKLYGVTRELLIKAAEYNVDWDFHRNGADGLENAVELAEKIERDARSYMNREYYESRL